ncbi:MAG: putative sugar nucleotidyl transferase [Bacteroidia bacterium]|nr:putative sugar nucleotidyl transferase [Bacteroidia bacterium]MDW8015364.1 putative sugar nucleotidyl transferase [Bacteroidia bacterium]
MRIGIFEDEGWQAFLPLTRLRPLWELWWGIDRLCDKWERYFDWKVVGYLPAQSLLHEVFPPVVPSEELVWLNARLLPMGPDLPYWLPSLEPDTLYTTEEGVPVALRTRSLTKREDLARFRTVQLPPQLKLYWIEKVTDLFQLNGQIIAEDWKHLRQKSAPLPSSLSVRGRDNIFFHPSARAGFAILAAEDGPIWVGPSAELQDGSIVQHTNVLGPSTTIMVGARIRTHNSFGPWCKIGGEVGQSTFLGFSNKAHDGFVGHSIIAQWCNIGAGSNTSNLKNTYGPVRLYSPALGVLQDTGLQFCGLIMGDYARCGIQTPFPTGCVVDIFANVVGTGFAPKYVPPFFWNEGQYWKVEKVIQAAQRMQERRGRILSEAEKKLLRTLHALLATKSVEG